jgi:hypothetical protein
MPLTDRAPGALAKPGSNSNPRMRGSCLFLKMNWQGQSLVLVRGSGSSGQLERTGAFRARFVATLGARNDDESDETGSTAKSRPLQPPKQWLAARRIVPRRIVPGSQPTSPERRRRRRYYCHLDKIDSTRSEQASGQCRWPLRQGPSLLMLLPHAAPRLSYTADKGMPKSPRGDGKHVTISPCSPRSTSHIAHRTLTVDCPPPHPLRGSGIKATTSPKTVERPQPPHLLYVDNQSINIINHRMH